MEELIKRYGVEPYLIYNLQKQGYSLAEIERYLRVTSNLVVDSNYQTVLEN